jgi:hypothetical protein
MQSHGLAYWTSVQMVTQLNLRQARNVIVCNHYHYHIHREEHINYRLSMLNCQ